MMMYLIAIVVGIVLSTFFGSESTEDGVGRRLMTVGRTGKVSIRIGPFHVNGFLVLIPLIAVFILDITYATYAASIRGILIGLTMAAFIGFAMRVMWHSSLSPWRLIVIVLLVIILAFSGFMKYVHPSNLEENNDLYGSMSRNEVTGENPNYINDTQEIRVVSWNLATDYLQRSYGDSAAYLQTNGSVLMKYTDPSYVNGEFVWINIPTYEFMKWFGEKEVPFFVYIVNDPATMGDGRANITHRVDTNIPVHMTKIDWSHRLEQIAFNDYAAEYMIYQARIDMDDDHNPYWILYLAKQDTWYGVWNLEKILIVDATNMDNTWEFSVDDPDIPSWLEVVYPDEYVYEWARFWGKNRLGIGYSMFNKGHLYEPDDSSARFIVVNGVTYWHIPMVQMDSHVIGGYMWINTRSGVPTFYNREGLRGAASLVDSNTVRKQVEKYLASGALGFQKLDIHECYLYPFKQDDGRVREAYVFPLYAGLTIAKYAIVDAEHYTDEPVVEVELINAVNRYRSLSGAPDDETPSVDWEEYQIMAAYLPSDATGYIVVSNTTGNSTFYVSEITTMDGIMTSDKEWSELNLAVSTWNRGDAVSIWFRTYGRVIIVVDWDDATLVTR